MMSKNFLKVKNERVIKCRFTEAKIIEHVVSKSFTFSLGPNNMYIGSKILRITSFVCSTTDH